MIKISNFTLFISWFCLCWKLKDKYIYAFASCSNVDIWGVLWKVSPSDDSGELHESKSDGTSKCELKIVYLNAQRSKLKSDQKKLNLEFEKKKDG